MMFSYYDDARAEELKGKALAFLEEWNLYPHPYCYVMAYDYVSRRNKNLVSQINKRIKGQEAITNEWIETAYKDLYLAGIAENHRSSVSLNDLVSQLVHVMREETDGSRDYLAGLEHASTRLEQPVERHQLNDVVSDLVCLTRDALNRQSLLTKRLSRTEQEIQTLNRSLSQTREAVETDPLTGLKNRFGLNNVIKQWRSSGEQCAMLLCDVDYFKKINDNYGHLIGDKVLARIGRELMDQVKGKDVVGRWGGEEFLVLLRDVSDAEQAKHAAESLRQAIEKIQLVHSKTRKQLPTITVSIGVTVLKDQYDWDAQFERADHGLYQSKASGRNCVIYVDSVE